MKLNEIKIIAPCGINCEVCYVHMREKNSCPGCLSLDDKHKPKHCTKCNIKFCIEHEKQDFIYCFDCTNFPCSRLKNLDKQYRTKYYTSLIENLNNIKEFGMEDFLIEEMHKWTCPQCGEKLSVHKDLCDRCKYIYRS